jgi:hypothetical protein
MDPNAGQPGAPTPNLGYNLTLRAVFFDYGVLTEVHDHDEEAYQKSLKEVEKITGIKAKKETRRVENFLAAGDAGSMLRDELRDELKRRGLDSTGKPHVIRDRLQKDFNSEPDRKPKKQSEMDAGTLGIRAKYAKALEGKKAKARAREMHGHLAPGSDDITSKQASSEDGGKWNLNKGTSEILKYMTTRGIKVGLILPSANELDGKDKGTLEAEVATFIKNSNAAFDFTMSSEAASQLPSGAPIEAACASLGVTPQQMLLVTSKLDYLEAARNAECFSAHLTVKNARRPNIRPTHTIYGLLDVQRAIEDYNGISWRVSAI